ncbi:hypothetical protein BXU08_05710 [Sphingomonas sp. LM7]|nr:hypothetical protein BXU08_05710 [Sphingomonas sp. LM7]
MKWVSLGTTRDGATFYDPAGAVRNGKRVQVSIRAVPESDTPISFIARVELDCEQPSLALISGQQFGADNEVVRSRTVPANQIERDPLFEGSEHAQLYRLICPKGPPLHKFKGPPIVVVPGEE